MMIMAIKDLNILHKLMDLVLLVRTTTIIVHLLGEIVFVWVTRQQV